VFFFFGLRGRELSVEDFGIYFRSCTGNRSHTSIRLRVLQQSCDISEQMSCLLIVGRTKQLADRTLRCAVTSRIRIQNGCSYEITESCSNVIYHVPTYLCWKLLRKNVNLIICQASLNFSDCFRISLKVQKQIALCYVVL